MRKHIAAWLLLAPVLAGAEYQIDSAHSSATFAIRHMMISNVRGGFEKVSGTIVYDPQNLSASRVDAVIDANTINTRDAKRDAHLRNPDFFDVAKYPTITFKSTRAYREDGVLKVKGDLTMHGVTKEVVLTVDGPTPEVKDARGGVRIGASATTRINRRDFGITYSRALEGGGLVVGDEVTITLDIEAVRKQ